MGRYKFTIEAYYTKNNYLEIEEKEKELFEIEGKKIFLKSLNRKRIKDSEGIEIESEKFDSLDECIALAKKVYSNFLLRLDMTNISYILDKALRGNFCNYCKDSDAEIYKEIIITDELNKDNNIYAIIEGKESGCTHFKFNKLLDVAMDRKIKNSLIINNYRKFLNDKEINSKLDNTLVSAAMEALIDKEERTKEELNVIDELITYLEEKYEKTNLIEYKKIESMIQRNKHKSIRSRKNELIAKYSKQEEINENIRLIDKVSRNRTDEIHNVADDINESVWADQLLFDIHHGYMKDLYSFNMKK
ncbi:MAG: hypothetical protein IKG58_03285 [Bacilli bacterium]|nr:hypothetical protein [Bacilli bacterium]MBR3049561.1 hypothetical protein [Bacilli bacterium]